MTTRRAGGPLGLALAALVMAGCGSPAASPGTAPGARADAACAGVEAEVPTAAAPGATIALELVNLYATCNDTGGGPDDVRTEVELELVAVDTSGAVVSTARAAVSPDATAVVHLTVPEDADGRYAVQLDGVPLGTLEVTGTGV